MPEPLNDLERRVLEYIVDYLRSNTYQPSIREIGRQFSIKSTKTVSELLQSLADKGWIERDPSRSRGVRVLGMESHPGTVSVPVVQDDLLPGSSFMAFDRRLVAAPGAFLMNMSAHHLREEGIVPGDLLLVEPVAADDVESGDIVVVRIGGTPMIRRARRDGGGLLLEPAASGEAAVVLTGAQAAAVLQGRVGAVVRRLRPVAQHVAARTTPIPS
jgi:repressor LexA